MPIELEQIAVIKRTKTVDALRNEEDVDFIVCYNQDMSSVSIDNAMYKLSDETLVEGFHTYEYAYVFNVMGSNFYLAMMVLFQNLDA